MNMPGGSGLELVREIARAHEDTAVLMITGVDDADVAALAIESGAFGYLIKPVSVNVLQLAVHNALRRRELEIENRNHRRFLERMVAERTAELSATIGELERASTELAASREETIQRLSRAAEFRSDETALHIQRMSLFCEHLATLHGEDDAWSERLRITSPMHDIGKIATPDAILTQPGKLTVDEHEVMKQHAEIGYRILAGSSSEMLQLAAEVAWTHHERWDGTGYPHGLRGDAIPLSGRIVAIADVFDALTSKRCYKPAFTRDRTRSIMFEGRGRHFDPGLLGLFWEHIDEFVAMRARNLDIVKD